MQIIPNASPNFDERGSNVKYIVLHYTGMLCAAAAISRLCDVEAKVSAHYLVDEAGQVYQLVDEEKRAWHAGVSYWQGEQGLNASSIGIEIVNKGHEHGYEDYPIEQINAVIALCLDIVKRNTLEPHNILAHSDIAPTRKEDPGEKFPWGLLYEKGLGQYVKPSPIRQGVSYKMGDEGLPVQALQTLLSRFGYELPVSGVYDMQTIAVVTAFQRHFRQEKVDGVTDLSTIETLHALLSG